MIVHKNGYIDYLNQIENPKIDPRKNNNLILTITYLDSVGRDYLIKDSRKIAVH